MPLGPTNEHHNFEQTLEYLRARVGHGCVVYISANGRQVATFAGLIAEVEPRAWPGDERPVYFCRFRTSPGAGYYGFLLDESTFERSWIEHHMTFVIAQGPIQIALEGRPFAEPVSAG